MRTTAVMLLALALVPMAGCSGHKTRQAHEEAEKVASDTKRVSRITDDATPETVRAVMGRPPDSVRRVGGQEVHYYLIQGAVAGEALRLVFQDGRLVGRSIVQTGQER